MPYLLKDGVECDLIPAEAERYCRERVRLAKIGILAKILGKLYSVWQLLRFLFKAAKYDVVFIQRLTLPLSFSEILKWINPNIVFDFDDALYLNKNKRYVKRFNDLLKNSRCLIVENNFTRNYALRFNQNVFIITGPIEVNRYSPGVNIVSRRQVVIGWIGSPATSVYVRPLGTVFKSLCAMYDNLSIHLIGAQKLDFDGVNIVVKEWRAETEVEELKDFDIGIMPLPDDDWSRGKGGYKILQYMSMGIPSVASPVGVNTEIIKPGVNGFLASNDSEWLDKLSLLIMDKALRDRLGRQGREGAVADYSYEASAPKLISALKKAIS